MGVASQTPQLDTSLPGRWVASGNFGERAARLRIDTLILHYTGMPCSERAVSWLCDPRSEVSCHYLIDEAGGIVQMVREAHRAWHAGLSSWEGETDINSCSIGIEIAHVGHAGGYPDFSLEQKPHVIALAKDICRRNGIPAHRVLAHSDVAPARKPDPGEKFYWDALAREGLGVWCDEAAAVAPGRLEELLGVASVVWFEAGEPLRLGAHGDAVSEVQAALCDIGYGIVASGAFDLTMQHVVTAFQRHWRRSQVDGEVDAHTAGMIAAVRAGYHQARGVKPTLVA